MMEIEDDEGDNEDVIEGDIMDDDDEAYHQWMNEIILIYVVTLIMWYL